MRVSLIALLIAGFAGACIAREPNSVTPPRTPGIPQATRKAFHNDPENFQFAVMADRTGGARRGVFEDAVRKLNLLQPEFVMSVGDTIGGYTTDTVALAQMWDEFCGLVDALEMPFYHVASNHDISNAVEAEVWAKRFGNPYYHFKYRGVLFLCLNTEDPPEGKLSDRQIAYFARVLGENPKPRWTFVFLHKPLWVKEEIPGSNEGFANSNWEKFEALLKGRPYTVFAGHTHQYYTSVRQGQDHIVMSTTGGGSEMRGLEPFGEFDHLAWVTMAKDGPRIANLMLDGIREVHLRSERAAHAVGRLSVSAVRGRAVRLEGDFTTRSTALSVSNPTEAAVEISAKAGESDDLVVGPAEFRLTLQPGEKRELAVTLAPKRKLAAGELPNPVEWAWAATFCLAAPGETTHTVPGKAVLAVDRVSRAVPAAKPVVVDGNLADWGGLPEGAQAPDGNGWTGPADAAYRFGVSYDDNNLYVAVDARDDRVILLPGRFPWEQDGIEIRVDARPDPKRSDGNGDGEMRDFMLFAMSPAAPGAEPTVFQKDKLPPGSRFACVKKDGGIAAEISIPRAWLDGKQGAPWKEIRVNVAQDDLDDPAEKESRLLWWRPDWRKPSNYRGSGTFVRQ